MPVPIAREAAETIPAAQAAGADPLTARPSFLLILLGALYFAQGIPLGLIFGAYPVLLRGAGVELSLLAWAPMLGLPWMLKFLWSPLVDSIWLPAMGRRRTWLVSQQLLVIGMLALLIATGAGKEAALSSLILLGLASTFAATQDIATDGLAAERLQGRHLALANAFSVGGIAAGMLVGGGGVLLVVDTLGLTVTLFALMVLLVICAVPALVWREPDTGASAVRHRATLRAVGARPHFMFVFAVAGLYAASHSADGALARLFLVDKGWSPAAIGTIDTLSMAAMIVLGCGGAAWLVSRLGTWRSLLVSLLLLAASTMGWFAIAWADIRPDLLQAALIRMLGSAGMGLASVAVYTILMLFARGGTQAGTDVTAFKSANVMGEIGAASLATALAAQTGYAGGFGLSIAVTACVVALALLRPSEGLLELSTARETETPA